MAQGENARLVAWADEMRAVHHRLRQALEVARDATGSDVGDDPDRGAIMESHFRYEERQLLTVLETLRLDAEPGDVFGPL